MSCRYTHFLTRAHVASVGLLAGFSPDDASDSELVRRIHEHRLTLPYGDHRYRAVVYTLWHSVQLGCLFSEFQSRAQLTNPLISLSLSLSLVPCSIMSEFPGCRVSKQFHGFKSLGLL